MGTWVDSLTPAVDSDNQACGWHEPEVDFYIPARAGGWRGGSSGAVDAAGTPVPSFVHWLPPAGPRSRPAPSSELSWAQV